MHRDANSSYGHTSEKQDENEEDEEDHMLNAITIERCKTGYKGSR